MILTIHTMNSLFAALDAGDKVKLAQLVHSFKESNANLNFAGAAGMLE